MTGPALLPPLLRTLPVEVLTVEPADVQPGDRPVGGPTIERIVFSGWSCMWEFLDVHDRVIVRRSTGQTIQVLRGGLSSNDTPPHGIARQVVA